jgi:carbamoyl-phosphate synthase small subunit
MAGSDLAKVVTTPKAYEWHQMEWVLGQGYPQSQTSRFKVVALDFGVKKNILRMLASRGCAVTVLPAQSSIEDIMRHKPDGVFLSNGPGDPEPCHYAIEATQALLKQKTPVFGICLGHQILALASGAKTFKMKFGHHGANHRTMGLPLT